MRVFIWSGVWTEGEAWAWAVFFLLKTWFGLAGAQTETDLLNLNEPIDANWPNLRHNQTGLFSKKPPVCSSPVRFGPVWTALAVMVTVAGRWCCGGLWFLRIQHLLELNSLIETLCCLILV